MERNMEHIEKVVLTADEKEKVRQIISLLLSIRCTKHLYLFNKIRAKLPTNPELSLLDSYNRSGFMYYTNYAIARKLTNQLLIPCENGFIFEDEVWLPYIGTQKISLPVQEGRRFLYAKINLDKDEIKFYYTDEKKYPKVLFDETPKA